MAKFKLNDKVRVTAGDYRGSAGTIKLVSDDGYAVELNGIKWAVLTAAFMELACQKCGGPRETSRPNSNYCRACDHGGRKFKLGDRVRVKLAGKYFGSKGTVEAVNTRAYKIRLNCDVWCDFTDEELFKLGDRVLWKRTVDGTVTYICDGDPTTVKLDTGEYVRVHWRELAVKPSSFKSGARPIFEFAIGQRVSTPMGYGSVVARYMRGMDCFYDIKLDDGSVTTVCTANLRAAHDFKPGDRVRWTYNGRCGTVVSIDCDGSYDVALDGDSAVTPLHARLLTPDYGWCPQYKVGDKVTPVSPGSSLYGRCCEVMTVLPWGAYDVASGGHPGIKTTCVFYPSELKLYEVEYKTGGDMNCIQIWAWNEAPQWAKNMSGHGGDEDWVALVPSRLAETGLVEAFFGDERFPPCNGHSGAHNPFGVCEIERHTFVNGEVLFIGAHA